MSHELPMIVGAGPVGLAGAVFLAQAGIGVRIVDAAGQAAPHSRALAVNPRTLQILEDSGVTGQMLAIGKRIVGGQLRAGGTIIGEVNFETLHPKYPFMLALSQAVTERLLEAKLNELGGRVEWNRALVGCANVEGNGVEAELKSNADGSVQKAQCPWLLAADGARSAVRHALGIEFEGSAFQTPWNLMDVTLETSLSEDHAHVIFLPGGGFLFLLRVIGDGDDARGGQGGGHPLWRIIGNGTDLLGPLGTAGENGTSLGRASGAAVWTSSFHIGHRINRRMQQGNVYFAGDAAHIHSPIGARGMNLGIEDAWAFSRMLAGGCVREYGERRRRVDGKVVRRIKAFTRVVGGQSVIARMLRTRALPMVLRIGPARRGAVRMMSGLDHPMPGGCGGR